MFRGSKDNSKPCWRLPAGTQLMDYRTEDAWLEARKRYIQASETPCLFGEGYGSPYHLYQLKKGMVDPATEDDEDRFWWGHANEPTVAAWYERKTNRQVYDLGEYVIVAHKQFPWLGATLDRLVWDKDRGLGVLELKCRSSWVGGKWHDTAPDDVLIQHQQQLMCSGLDWGSVAVMVGGTSGRYVDIDRNTDVCDLIAEVTKVFKDRLDHNDPPDIDGHPSTTRALKILHPADNGNTIPLPADILAIDERRREVMLQLVALNDEKDVMDNQIRNMIGDNTFGFGPTFEYSLKTQERDGYLAVSPIMAEALRAEGIEFKQHRGSTFRVLRRRSINQGDDS